MIDIKCGKCETVFSVKIDEYKKRMSNNMRFLCPSCLAYMPRDLNDRVSYLISSDTDNEGWEIGTRLLDFHKCK